MTFLKKLKEMLVSLTKGADNYYWYEYGAYPFTGSYMATALKIRNDSPSAVTAYITLGATPGCVQDVADISGVLITKMYPLMGYFSLPAGVTYTLFAPEGMGFNGNFSFSTPPLNCPTAEFPNGVNLAEFIINNGFQGPYAQETIDISCVAGVNCLIVLEVNMPGWTTNAGKTAVLNIANGAKLDNTNRPGVFPYGCDNCTSSDNPPGCVGKQPQYANKDPICNVQRPGPLNQGGSLTVVYKGPI